ncbi:MAG: hypothetical protein IJB41_01075 [Clostridia bacterium]|nr:hypothetical protein [Clostridia bacterium]
MNIDHIISRIYATVKNHELPEKGAYARWLWQNEKGSRKLGANEYGCADAANILYTIGAFPRENALREACVQQLQQFQDPETGLFYEGTHHTIHCTAHCIAALELFDAGPVYPLDGLSRHETKEGLEELLENLLWEESPWNNAHQGAGIYAAFVLTGKADPDWQDWYFGWLDKNADPDNGISRRGAVQAGKLRAAHHLFGWFHYMFNYAFARRPFPCAKATVDTCIDLYKNNDLGDDFMREINFCEIDWVYALNRAAIQENYRIDEARELMWDMAQKYIAYLEQVDVEKHEGWNDLHALFGVCCALAELQQALPGKIETSYPLKLVLDRRPFI